MCTSRWRVGAASYGTDWQAAQAAVASGYDGALFGQTPVILGPGLGASAGPGTVIWGLSSSSNPNVFKGGFYLFPSVPEPCTMALFSLGFAALLILRRRK